MKTKLWVSVGACLAAGTVLAAAAWAETPAGSPAETSPGENGGLGLEIGLGVVSRDLWRGFELNHGDFSFQPWIYYEPPRLGWLAAELVFAMGLEEKAADMDTETALDEIDLYLTAKHSLGFPKLIGSLILNQYIYTSDFYSMDGANRYDIELGASLAYEPVDWFKPYLAYYRGFFEDIQGNYLEAGIDSTVPLVEETIEVQPKLSAGFFSNQYGIDDAFAQLEVDVPLVFYVNAVTIYLTPKYCFVPEADFGNDTNIFAAGLDVSYTF